MYDWIEFSKSFWFILSDVIMFFFSNIDITDKHFMGWNEKNEIGNGCVRGPIDQRVDVKYPHVILDKNKQLTVVFSWPFKKHGNDYWSSSWRFLLIVVLDDMNATALCFTAAMKRNLECWSHIPFESVSFERRKWHSVCIWIAFLNWYSSTVSVTSLRHSFN